MFLLSERKLSLRTFLLLRDLLRNFPLVLLLSLLFRRSFLRRRVLGRRGEFFFVELLLLLLLLWGLLLLLLWCNGCDDSAVWAPPAHPLRGATSKGLLLLLLRFWSVRFLLQVPLRVLLLPSISPSRHPDWRHDARALLGTHSLRRGPQYHPLRPPLHPLPNVRPEGGPHPRYYFAQPGPPRWAIGGDGVRLNLAPGFSPAPAACIA